MLLLYLFLLISIISSKPLTINEKLLQAQSLINNSSQKNCFNSHSGTVKSLRHGTWSQQLDGELSIVYPFCLTTNELGNKLGNYFTELSCALDSGIHFISVHKQWDLSGSFHGMNETSILSDRFAFLSALPDLMIHPNPLPKDQVHLLIQEKCQCTRYCWQDKNAPWVRHISEIRNFTRKAIEAYLSHSTYKETEVNRDVDITNFQNNDPNSLTSLPLIPDVAIQYRCGDNIGFNYMYGILPFTAYPSRIPATAKLIYILSDHPNRASHSPYSARCQTILERLFQYLTSHFPRSTVLVKRGGDIFLDYARLALANTTICSASSFCLWPALANTGEVHFPLTSLVAGADSMDLAPPLIDNFHWIPSPELISSFHKLRPWTLILDVLEGKMEMPK